MKKRIDVKQAVVLWLKNSKHRVAFFDSELLDFIRYLRKTKELDGYTVEGIRINSNVKKKFYEVIDYLIERKIVDSYDGYFVVTNSVVGRLEILCSLYEIGYISYLSAMYYYKLTNMVSEEIHYTAPNRLKWKNYYKQTSEDTIEIKRPYPSERIEIAGKYLNLHVRSHIYTPNIVGNNIRVIGIGDLFLEMTKYPNLCGGFEEVLKIFKYNAKYFINDIVLSVERYGSLIDKSRIGYLISSYLDIDNQTVLSWKNHCLARGGNRKMVSKNDYSELYSAEWNLSLNHEVFSI